MERYNVHDEYMTPSEAGNVVLHADAQRALDAERELCAAWAEKARQYELELDGDPQNLHGQGRTFGLRQQLATLQAQLRQVEEALQERKEFIADCDTALDRIQAPRTNEGQEELVSTWRRIELLGKLLYQYRQELERSAPTLRDENARLWRGLENCHMLARRIVVSESTFFKIDSANHIIRMCEEAGVTSVKGVLKDAALQPERGKP